MDLIIIVIVLLIVLAETCAQSSIQTSALTHNTGYFALGLLFYALVAILLKQSFRARGMAIINALWSALSVIAVAGVGYFYFGEDLTRSEIFAVGLATIAAAIIVK
jgi:multidrug transporter EmrE-like cation transporter